MAKKDANDTRRGNRVVTDLSQRRLDQRKAGDKPKCGSPLAGSNVKGHKNYGKGKTCDRLAGAGTDHPGYGACSWHAGNMKPAKVTAARERAYEQVENMRDSMRFYGVAIEIGFEEALLEELQRSVGIVRWIEAKLSRWGEPQAEGGNWKWDSSDTGLPPLLREVHGFRNVIIADTEYGAWLRQYQLERRHLHAIAADGIKAGIAKSMVVVYQQQADTMNAIIRITLERLGVGDDDRLPTILPEVIREVTSKKRAS